jgi:hypothetical protein
MEAEMRERLELGTAQDVLTPEAMMKNSRAAR